jgi:GNAT superfamily N-acetyltransferase
MSGEGGKPPERTERTSVDPELLKECHENLVQVFELIASLVPGGTVERCGGITVVRTGYPLTIFNPVVALDTPKTPVGLSGIIDRILVRTGTPWALMTTPGTSEGLASLRDEFRLARSESTPGMVFSYGGSPLPSPPEGLDIHRVTERGELQVYWRTVAEVFELDLSFFDKFADGMIAHQERFRRWYCYLGYSEGRPIGTALLCTTPRVAGVYNVGTNSEYRRRGYGRALSLRAALDGLGAGCRISWLQASDMGGPLYEKLGYRAVEDLCYWVPSSAAKSASSSPTWAGKTSPPSDSLS